ncbi:MAG TPA: hypothetical protein VIW27_06520 [Gammaproteobacteria bacterium]
MASWRGVPAMCCGVCAASLARRLALLLLLSAVLQGCGFRLAGTATLPPELARIQLETRDFDNRQRDVLLRRLQRAGAEVSVEPAADRTRLSVRLLAPRDRRLVTSASSGRNVNRVSRVLEYSLWSADGQLRAGPSSLTAGTDVTLDDDSLLSSSDERQSAIEELETNLYDQLIRQLQRLQ